MKVTIYYEIDERKFSLTDLEDFIQILCDLGYKVIKYDLAYIELTVDDYENSWGVDKKFVDLYKGKGLYIKKVTFKYD